MSESVPKTMHTDPLVYVTRPLGQNIVRLQFVCLPDKERWYTFYRQQLFTSFAHPAIYAAHGGGWGRDTVYSHEHKCSFTEREGTRTRQKLRCHGNSIWYFDEKKFYDLFTVDHQENGSTIFRWRNPNAT